MPLESWPRPRFTPGGGQPLLMYFVYGNCDPTRPLNSSNYRVSGIPDGLDLRVHDRETHPDGFFGLLSDSFWRVVTRDKPDLAEAVVASQNCVRIQGTVADSPSLDYFRDTIGLVTWLLDDGGIAVLDPQMLRLWSKDEWKMAVFEPAQPNPRNHVVLLASPEPDGRLWLHTRGMRKFGRPDLSVNGVDEANRSATIDLINRFIEYQALGGVIEEGEEIRVRSLPPGGVCRHSGSLDDPDFNNVHVSIEWPNGLRP